MTSEQKDSIASVLITQKFSKGQNIIIEGDPGSSFYIIKEVFYIGRAIINFENRVLFRY